MRLFQVVFSEPDSYGWTLDNVSYHEQYADRRAEYPTKLAEFNDQLAKFGIIVVNGTPTVITATQLLDLQTSKVQFDVKQEISHHNDEPIDAVGAIAKFNRLAQKLISLPALQTINKPALFNEKCEVHMPGQALSTYNETLLLEDECTDELQRHLDKGWRIIACCPQPDQRRPDYILGRFHANYDQ